MAKLKKSFYDQSTAKFYRKLGDTIMVASGSASAMCMGLPVEETTKLWLVFIFGIIGMIGKAVTNLFTEAVEEVSETEEINEP